MRKYFRVSLSDGVHYREIVFFALSEELDFLIHEFYEEVVDLDWGQHILCLQSEISKEDVS